MSADGHSIRTPNKTPKSKAEIESFWGQTLWDTAQTTRNMYNGNQRQHGEDGRTNPLEFQNNMLVIF